MKEVLEEIKQLQIRLINAGGSKITITKDDFNITLINEDEIQTNQY